MCESSAQLLYSQITHLVSTYSYEGSPEEDAELRLCACGKSVALYVSSTLQRMDERIQNID